ncbi:MAG: nucleotidyltransferase family protein [Pyrinomonadaceae bacterium]
MSASCWPTKSQELLLRACLLSGHEAAIAWRQWQSIFDARSFDEGSRRLLPLLYRNLRKQKIIGPEITRLKEDYFYTWSQNQFCLRGIETLIDAFNQRGIRNILLKGSALALLYYEDVGLRPMKDIDVLVCRNQAKQSMQLLTSLGWKPRYASPEAFIPFEQAIEFISPNSLNLDLHWRLMWEGRQDLDDDEFWAASMPMRFEGTETRALNSADQLLHVCVHGAKWNDTSSLRWIADAMMIIQSQKFDVDWTRVVRLARERQLILPLRETLSYLNRLLEAGVSTEVLTELQGARITRFERWSYRTRLGRNDSLKMLTVVWHWMNSLWVNCEGTTPQRLVQFSRYLQSLWSVTSAWKIPFYLLVKPTKRIYSTIKLNLRGASASD